MRNNFGAREQNEITSQRVVQFWSSRGEYIGEVYIDDEQFVVVGKDNEHINWLNERLDNTWEPQRGIPTSKKRAIEFFNWKRWQICT